MVRGERRSWRLSGRVAWLFRERDLVLTGVIEHPAGEGPGLMMIGHVVREDRAPVGSAERLHFLE